MVARRNALQPGGKIEPKLQRLHASGAGHFAVHDAAARGHELHVARAEAAGPAGVIGMHELAGEDEGHRLDAPVGMGRKTGRRREPVLGHQQERAVLGDILGRDDHAARYGRARAPRAGPRCQRT